MRFYCSAFYFWVIITHAVLLYGMIKWYSWKWLTGIRTWDQRVFACI